MKFFKKSVLILLLAVAANCKASNLEFNQVILLDTSQPTFSITVPSGQVWEIVGTTSTNCFININGILSFSGSSNTAGYPTMFPVWLPANTVISNQTLSPYSPPNGLLSIIEFNIVP